MTQFVMVPAQLLADDRLSTVQKAHAISLYQYITYKDEYTWRIAGKAITTYFGEIVATRSFLATLWGVTPDQAKYLMDKLVKLKYFVPIGIRRKFSVYKSVLSHIAKKNHESNQIDSSNKIVEYQVDNHNCETKKPENKPETPPKKNHNIEVFQKKDSSPTPSDETTTDKIKKIWQEKIAKDFNLNPNGNFGKFATIYGEKSIDHLKSVYRLLNRNKFLRGENKNNWQMTFNWLMLNDDTYPTKMDRILANGYPLDKSAKFVKPQQKQTVTIDPNIRQPLLPAEKKLAKADPQSWNIWFSKADFAEKEERIIISAKSRFVLDKISENFSIFIARTLNKKCIFQHPK